MNQAYIRKFLYSLLLVWSGSAMAEAGGVQLGDVLNTLLTGSGVLTKLMWGVCIVVGIALIAAAFTQFQIHRRNPKLVPLATPVLYLILGIIAIGLPFMSQIEGFIGGVQPGIRQAPAPAAQPYNPNDIDAPMQ